MIIELLYVGDCPNYDPARAVLQEAIRLEQVAADVAEVEIKDEAMARANGFIGSPSIRINRADVDPGAGRPAPSAMCCRTYDHSGVLKGTPTREMIRRALRRAKGELTRE